MNIERFINPAIIAAPEDESVVVLSLAEKMEQQGVKFIHMDLGRPDFDSPAPAKQEAGRALQAGKVHYTSLSGIPELKRAVAEYEQTRHGLALQADKNVLITVGASEALFGAWLNFLQPGDEVLIPTPCYCAYLYMLAALGIKVVEIPTVKGSEANIDIEAFRQRLSANSKMLVVNSPQNPSGLVYTKEQLLALAQLAIEHDLLVVADECYDNYIYSGEHLSIASLPGMWERTITVNSLSKTYSMTGWRVGYAVAHEAFIEVMSITHANLILCAPSFAQYGAVEALQTIENGLAANQTEFRRRRDLLIQWMDKIGLPYIKPTGAFYVFFDVSLLNMSGLEFCIGLLEEQHITSMPGSIYGSDYKNYVRLAYTCGYEELKQGMQGIATYVQKHLGK